MLDDNPNALWSRVVIEKSRVSSFPDLIRVVVGVDPSGSSSGAECGIVAGGKAYVDGAAHYQPFPRRSDCRETNYGGEMVEATIRNVPGGAQVSYKAVHATRGKAVRAGRRVLRAGEGSPCRDFPLLETKLCEWVSGEKSPNRLDTLVWTITDLMDEVEFRTSDFEL